MNAPSPPPAGAATAPPAGWVWAFRAALAVAVLALLVLTLGPRPNLLAWDKAEHFCGGFGLLLLWAGSFPRAPVRRAAFILAAAMILAELAQLALPGRSADPNDALSGLAGLAAACAALSIAAFRARMTPRPG